MNMKYIKTYESFGEGNRGYVMQVISAMCEDGNNDFKLLTTSIKNGVETDTVFVFELEKGPDLDVVHAAIERLDDIGYFAKKVNWIHAFHCIMIYKKDSALVDYLDDDQFKSDVFPKIGDNREESQLIYNKMISKYEHVIIRGEAFLLSDEVHTINAGDVTWKDGKFEWVPKTMTRHFATIGKSFGNWRTWYSPININDVDNEMDQNI